MNKHRNMSVIFLNHLTVDEFYESHDIFIDKFVKQVIKENDDKKYPIKNPNDKFVCKICHGRYCRSEKARHEKSNKHQNKIIEIKDYLKLLVG